MDGVIIKFNERGRLVFGKPFVVITGSVVREHSHKIVMKWK